MLKHLLGDRRRSFKTENLAKYLLIYYDKLKYIVQIDEKEQDLN